MANDTWYRRIDGKGNVREELFMSEKDASLKGLMPPGLEFRVVIDGSEEHMRAVKDSPAHKHEMLVAQATLNRAVINDKDSVIQSLQAERDRLREALRIVYDCLYMHVSHLCDMHGDDDEDGLVVARRALEGDRG